MSNSEADIEVLLARIKELERDNAELTATNSRLMEDNIHIRHTGVIRRESLTDAHCDKCGETGHVIEICECEINDMIGHAVLTARRDELKMGWK